MNPEKKELPITWQLIIANILPLILTLIVTTVLMLTFTIKVANDRLESELKSIAYVISKTEIVIQSLNENRPNEELNTYLDLLSNSNTDIDIITIADMTGKRIYHIDKDQIGKAFIGGDDGPVYEGKHYSSIATGTQGEQMRYFFPIDNEEGVQIGFVMASTRMAKIHALERYINHQMLTISTIVLLFGILIAYFLSRKIKINLIGYEPSQIGQLFTEREEIFNSLEESIIAINQYGKIIFTNKSARTLLNIDKKMDRKSIDAILPEIKLTQTLKTGQISNNRPAVIHKQDVLYDAVPIMDQDQIIGALAVIRDRTEFKRLAEQLTNVNHFVDALRANNHEFMNKLHIILGLLEIGETNEAIEYIAGLSQREKMIAHTVSERIENRKVAALLLGKISRGNELDINVKLLPNSYLPRHSQFLSTDSLVTIIGNLIENAMEAINGEFEDDHEEEVVTVFIHEDEQALIISVDDSGQGMTEKVRQRILTTMYSTKGENRGTGMALIRQVIENHKGEITIESTVDVGTSIIITFNQKR